jgi:hypothetical protein
MTDESWRSEIRETALLLEAVSSGDRTLVVKSLTDYLLSKEKREAEQAEEAQHGDEYYEEGYEGYGDEFYGGEYDGYYGDQYYGQQGMPEDGGWANQAGGYEVNFETDPYQQSEGYGYENFPYYSGEARDYTSQGHQFPAAQNNYNEQPFMSGAYAGPSSQQSMYQGGFDNGYLNASDYNARRRSIGANYETDAQGFPQTAPARRPLNYGRSLSYQGSSPAEQQYDQNAYASSMNDYDWSQGAGDEFYDENSFAGRGEWSADGNYPHTFDESAQESYNETYPPEEPYAYPEPAPIAAEEVAPPPLPPSPQPTEEPSDLSKWLSHMDNSQRQDEQRQAAIEAESNEEDAAEPSHEEYGSLVHDDDFAAADDEGYNDPEDDTGHSFGNGTDAFPDPEQDARTTHEEPPQAKEEDAWQPSEEYAKSTDGQKHVHFATDDGGSDEPAVNTVPDADEQKLSAERSATPQIHITPAEGEDQGLFDEDEQDLEPEEPSQVQDSDKRVSTPAAQREEGYPSPTEEQESPFPDDDDHDGGKMSPTDQDENSSQTPVERPEPWFKSFRQHHDEWLMGLPA